MGSDGIQRCGIQMYGYASDEIAVVYLTKRHLIM